MNKKQAAVINAARVFRRAVLNGDLASVLEDTDGDPPRSSASWYEEATEAQRVLFDALEAIDGPFVYEAP